MIRFGGLFFDFVVFINILLKGFTLGMGFALGIGLVMKIDAWLDYKRHGG